MQITTLIALCISSANSGASDTKITINNDQRCIRSNGLPNHSTGTFPNSGNPHSIKQQNHYFCIDLNPQKGQQPHKQQGSVGIALNGVLIRPGTADFWDNNSPRGHSRDSSSGWNLEGLGSRDALGMDQNNAHVDHNGIYHYHGIAKALVDSVSSSLVGYAADGFEIHYSNKQTSSYRLKQGQRPSGPGGKYDGKYNQDWEFIAGLGSLDQCNGGEKNGKFVYYATDTYPFFPRCLWGNISHGFNQKRQSQSQTKQNRLQPSTPQQQSRPALDGVRKPPTAAINACQNKSIGNDCSFKGRGHQVNGSCRQIPQGEMACIPKNKVRPK